MSAIVVHRVPFVKLVSLSHSHCEEAQKTRASFAQSKALDSFSTFSLAVPRFTSLFALVDYPFRLLFSITFDLTRRFCAGKKSHHWSRKNSMNFHFNSFPMLFRALLLSCFKYFISLFMIVTLFWASLLSICYDVTAFNTWNDIGWQ